MEPQRATFGKYMVLANLAEANTILVQHAAEAGFARLLVIRSLVAGDPSAANNAALVADARRAARLQHPNIQQIHEVGTAADGIGYIALEYLEGIPYDQLLRARNRERSLADPRLYCALLAQTCEGLHQGHRYRGQGGQSEALVHGCLRPERLFLTSGGTIKLLDFGLRRMCEAASTAQIADPQHYGYMAPEQILGRRVDPRTDIFSVGVLAWESLTGRRLFSRPTRVEVLRAVTQDPLPPPAAIEPSIPGPLSDVVSRALARNPEERFQTARELGVALEEAVTSIGSPLSTVAIAASVDRYFSSELETQRSVVLKARRDLDDAIEDDDLEVPTMLFDAHTDNLDFSRQIPTRPGRPQPQLEMQLKMAQPQPLPQTQPQPQTFQPPPPMQPRPAMQTPPRPIPSAPPESRPTNGPDFARPPETLSDVGGPPSRRPALGPRSAASSTRGLWLVFVILILAAAGGAAGYMYWLDLQQPAELSD